MHNTHIDEQVRALHAAMLEIVSAMNQPERDEALMREAIGACETHFPGTPIALSAQSHLERFYRSLGFSPTSEEYVEDGIPHIDMIRPADGRQQRC